MKTPSTFQRIPYKVTAWQVGSAPYSRIANWAKGSKVLYDGRRVAGIQVRENELAVKGDWIMRRGRALFVVVPAEAFAATFEPAPAAPKVRSKANGK
jgi:hypothetical protein